MGGTYEEIKKEMLLAHGQTDDKLWKQLITTTQESESFRRWCVHIATKLVQFIQLTNETSLLLMKTMNYHHIPADNTRR